MKKSIMIALALLIGMQPCYGISEGQDSKTPVSEQEQKRESRIKKRLARRVKHAEKRERRAAKISYITEGIIDNWYDWGKEVFIIVGILLLILVVLPIGGGALAAL